LVSCSRPHETQHERAKSFLRRNGNILKWIRCRVSKGTAIRAPATGVPLNARHSNEPPCMKIVSAFRAHHRDLNSSSQSSDTSAEPHEIFAKAFERLSCGVVIVDEELRPIFANRIAERLIDAGRLPLTTKATLYRADPIDGIRRAVAALESTKCGATCRVGEPPLICTVAPLERSTAARAARAIIFVTDPARARSIEAGDLAALGLTRAEGAVAVEFVNGHTLQACARRLSISIATAKTHLKSIFAKTGTRRQAQLMRFILTSMPTFVVSANSQSD